jgi:hypothetical protein
MGIRFSNYFKETEEKKIMEPTVVVYNSDHSVDQINSEQCSVKLEHVEEKYYLVLRDQKGQILHITFSSDAPVYADLYQTGEI